MNNDYKILGLPETATLEEVKKAYRKLAMQNHPDRNPNDPEKADLFDKITKAYDRIGRHLNGETVKVADSDHDTDPTTGQKIVRTIVALDLGFNFNGGVVTYEGHSLRLPPGFISGEVASWTLSDGRTIHCTVSFKDSPGFDVVGKNIYTFTKVSQASIDEGRLFNIRNHPAPIGPRFRIPKDLTDGQQIIIEGHGLLHSEGTRGNLYVTVAIINEPVIENDVVFTKAPVVEKKKKKGFFRTVLESRLFFVLLLALAFFSVVNHW